MNEKVNEESSIDKIKKKTDWIKIEDLKKKELNSKL